MAVIRKPPSIPGTEAMAPMMASPEGGAAALPMLLPLVVAQILRSQHGDVSPSAASEAQKTYRNPDVTGGRGGGAGAGDTLAARMPAMGAEGPPEMPPEAAAESARNYVAWVVKPGDTLWSISERVYGDPLKLGRIFKANRSEIKDPNMIRPGQRLMIPPREEKGEV